MVTFPVTGHHCRTTGTKLYCLVTEAYACEQLAQGRYLTAKQLGVELATSRVASRRPNHYTTRPPSKENAWEMEPLSTSNFRFKLEHNTYVVGEYDAPLPYLILPVDVRQTTATSNMNPSFIVEQNVCQPKYPF